MTDVIWSEEAQADFNDYIDYLEANSPHAAERAVDDIFEASARLGRFPYMGRQGRDLSTREISLLRWRKIMVYEVFDDHVAILALFDARQDV